MNFWVLSFMFCMIGFANGTTGIGSILMGILGAKLQQTRKLTFVFLACACAGSVAIIVQTFLSCGQLPFAGNVQDSRLERCLFIGDFLLDSQLTPRESTAI